MHDVRTAKGHGATTLDTFKNGVPVFEIDAFGRLIENLNTEGMTFPVACGSCGFVHDSGKVEIVARYADCDMWRCPKCNLLQDNRWYLNSPSTARKLY